jgi:hypothetical protein
MKQRILTSALLVSLALLCLSVYAQINRPYRNGSVWDVAFIRMKPGMETAYLTYLTTDWKREQEALKSNGYSLSYKVLQTESHNPNDFNIILMTEFKDLASLEANEKKMDALSQQVAGNDQKQQQGYREREPIRDVLGDRLAREIVLEPRP